MEIKTDNKSATRLWAEQNMNAIINCCETLKNIYIKTNDEIDIDILVKFQDISSFIVDLKNEIK